MACWILEPPAAAGSRWHARSQSPLVCRSVPLGPPSGGNPWQARLPLPDGVLDLVHWGLEASPAPMALPLLRFQEILYEWDRVLRVGEPTCAMVLLLV